MEKMRVAFVGIEFALRGVKTNQKPAVERKEMDSTTIEQLEEYFKPEFDLVQNDLGPRD